MMYSSNCFVAVKFHCDQGFHVEAEVLPYQLFCGQCLSSSIITFHHTLDSNLRVDNS